MTFMRKLGIQLFFLLLVANVSFAQKCRFETEENIDDEDNIKVQTTEIILSGIPPNNLSISFLKKGLSYFISLDYVKVTAPDVSVNGVRLPKSKLPDIARIDTSCMMSIIFLDGDKIVLKTNQEQKAQKRNLSKSSSEFKIDDFLFQISSEDIELIQNSVIDKIVFQYFSSDSTDIQTESTQISEMRYDKIKNFAFCILNYDEVREE